MAFEPTAFENTAFIIPLQRGKDAVTEYHAAHANLYSMGWYQGISEDHIPLLNNLLAILSTNGFNSLQEFYAAGGFV